MKKIFVVDDDELFLRMIERMFVAKNFTVESAMDGADALAKLYMTDEAPSVIVLDIMIPILSGVEVLKKIKESDKLKNIPVVILSNLSPPKESEQSILALGALMYLHKSEHTPAELIEKIKSVIAK